MPPRPPSFTGTFILPCLGPLRLKIDTQTIGQPVVVGEQPGDLNDFTDRLIVEALVAERPQIRSSHTLGMQRQLANEVEHRTVGHREIGCSVVRLDGRDQVAAGGRVENLGTEVLSMRPCSVKALVNLRHHRRDHLALPASQPTVRTMHGFQIELSRSPHQPRPQALYLNDLKDLTGAFSRRIVLSLQQPGGCRWLNRGYPCHDPIEQQPPPRVKCWGRKG